MEVSAVAYAVEAVISVGAVVGAFVGEGNLIANQTRITPAMATRIEIWVVDPICPLLSEGNNSDRSFARHRSAVRRNPGRARCWRLAQPFVAAWRDRHPLARSAGCRSPSALPVDRLSTGQSSGVPLGRVRAGGAAHRDRPAGLGSVRGRRTSSMTSPAKSATPSPSARPTVWSWLNPYPWTVTELPAGPELGVTTRLGFIVKLAAPSLPLVWPVPIKMREPNAD
jgi:hypothetical protein